MSKIKPINSNPTKEFHRLLKIIGPKTNNQASLKSYNLDDISNFVIEICPKDGLYKNGKFLFQFQLCGYPREHPNVICLTEIYHPNIEIAEVYHNICLNIFDNWNKTFNLLDIIHGLIFLLYQPNLSDPISSGFNCETLSEEEFKKNVYNSLHGGFVEGYEFIPNYGIVEYEQNLANENSNSLELSNNQTDKNKVVSIDEKDDKNLAEPELLINNDNYIHPTKLDFNVVNDNIDYTDETDETDDCDALSTIEEELAKLNSNNTNIHAGDLNHTIIIPSVVGETIQYNDHFTVESTALPIPIQQEDDKSDEDSDSESTIYDEGVYADDVNTETAGGYVDAVWSRFENRGQLESSSDNSESQEEHAMAHSRMGRYYFQFERGDDDEYDIEGYNDDFDYDDEEDHDEDEDEDEDNNEDDSEASQNGQYFQLNRSSSIFQSDRYIVLPDLNNIIANKGNNGIGHFNYELMVYEFMRAWIFHRRVTNTFEDSPHIYSWIIYNDEYRIHQYNHRLFLNVGFGRITNFKSPCRYTHILVWLMNITKLLLMNTIHPVSTPAYLYIKEPTNYPIIKPNSSRLRNDSLITWLIRTFINGLVPEKTIALFTSCNYLIHYLARLSIIYLCTNYSNGNNDNSRRISFDDGDYNSSYLRCATRYHECESNDQLSQCLFVSRSAHLYLNRPYSSKL